MTQTSSLRVFVASTSEDLGNHRKVAKEAILETGWHPILQTEHAGTSTQPTVAACLKGVESSGLVLLIIAWRRGWVPTRAQGGDDVRSITALELDHARKKKIAVRILMADESWPDELRDQDADARMYLKEFRGGINQPAVLFAYEPFSNGGLPGFHTRIRDALVSHKAELLAERSGRTVRRWLIAFGVFSVLGVAIAAATPDARPPTEVVRERYAFALGQALGTLGLAESRSPGLLFEKSLEELGIPALQRQRLSREYAELEQKSLARTQPDLVERERRQFEDTVVAQSRTLIGEHLAALSALGSRVARLRLILQHWNAYEYQAARGEAEALLREIRELVPPNLPANMVSERLMSGSPVWRDARARTALDEALQTLHQHFDFNP